MPAPNILNLVLDGYSAVLCAVMAGYVLAGLVAAARREAAGAVTVGSEPASTGMRGADMRVAAGGVAAKISAAAQRSPLDLCFVGICVANTLMALGDATSWLWQPPLGAGQLALLRAGTFVFWAAPAPMFLCFTGYIVAFVRQCTRVPAGYLRLSAVLFALYLAGCVASLVVPVFFGVSAQTGYVRGPLFLLGQVVPVVLHTRNGLIVFRYRRYFSLKEQLSFLSYLVLPFAAEALQVPLYGLALMNTAVALATLIVFMNIQASYRAELAERERELAEARGNVMLSQIQPHFLYNTLTAIRELCQSDPAQAAEMIGRFSRYLRENMASLTSREPIAIERELRHVATYLELEQRRFGERLQVTWEVEALSFACPPLVVQPVVENAVRHGVMRRVEGGRVTIATFEDERASYVEVRDDGVGFEAERVLTGFAPEDAGAGAGVGADASGASALASGEHVGLRNVALRLREVCDGSLAITSAPGEGTCVRLSFPKHGSGGGGERPPEAPLGGALAARCIQATDASTYGEGGGMHEQANVHRG